MKLYTLFRTERTKAEDCPEARLRPEPYKGVPPLGGGGVAPSNEGSLDNVDNIN